jgi:hypothetical protein
MNFITGGKLGDFLHSLYAVKNLCEKYQCTANIYMIDIGWDFGIENTHRELRPILKQQDYINDIYILTDYYLDPIQNPFQNSPIQIFNKKLIDEGYIVNDYLNSRLLYKECWSSIYQDLFDFKATESHWITYNQFDAESAGRILVHRKNNDMKNQSFPYDQICDEYQDNMLFVSSTENDYEEFPWKSRMPFKKITTLEDWFAIINSCSMIISNLTGPTVIAHALDKKRIIELPDRIDALHCIGEERYSSNIYWYLNQTSHNLS